MSKRNRNKRKFDLVVFVQCKGDLPYRLNLDAERQALINKQYFAQLSYNIKVTDAKYQRLVKLAKYQRFVNQQTS